MYIPTSDDIDPKELVTIATGGDISPIADRLNLSTEKLQRLLLQDEFMNDMVQSAVAEVEALSRINLTLLIPKALEALELGMKGGIDAKRGMTTVKAAEIILDRTLPKKGRDTASNAPKGVGSLPSIADLLEGAKSPEEAMALMEQQQRLMADIDNLRDKARRVEIINVTPEVIEK